MPVQQSATVQISLTIYGVLTVPPQTPPAGAVGAAYSYQFAVTGGKPPYTWAVAAGSTLPPGLTLSSTGLLSGTPTAGGDFTFSLTVTDAES